MRPNDAQFGYGDFNASPMYRGFSKKNFIDDSDRKTESLTPKIFSSISDYLANTKASTKMAGMGFTSYSAGVLLIGFPATASAGAFAAVLGFELLIGAAFVKILEVAGIVDALND